MAEVDGEFKSQTPSVLGNPVHETAGRDGTDVQDPPLSPASHPPFSPTLGKVVSSAEGSERSEGSEDMTEAQMQENEARMRMQENDEARIQENLVSFITRLEASRSSIIHGAPAFRVLRGFGRVLRRSRYSPEKLYKLGNEVSSIDEFWSHSWHGSTLWKIWLFLMLKNGVAACVTGTVAAIVLASLSHMRILPGYSKEPFYDETGFTGEYHFAPWANLGGNLVALLTLLFWPSRDRVFVDRVCIHQGDQGLKAEALLNLGVFLRKSKKLIVHAVGVSLKSQLF